MYGIGRICRYREDTGREEKKGKKPDTDHFFCVHDNRILSGWMHNKEFFQSGLGRLVTEYKNPAGEALVYTLFMLLENRQVLCSDLGNIPVGDNNSTTPDF